MDVFLVLGIPGLLVGQDSADPDVIPERRGVALPDPVRELVGPLVFPIGVLRLKLSQVELGKNAASMWALARISNSLGMQLSTLLKGL